MEKGATESGLLKASEKGGKSDGERPGKEECNVWGNGGGGGCEGMGGKIDEGGCDSAAVRRRANSARAMACRCRKAMSVADFTLSTGETLATVPSVKRIWAGLAELKLTRATLGGRGGWASRGRLRWGKPGWGPSRADGLQHARGRVLPWWGDYAQRNWA